LDRGVVAPGYKADLNVIDYAGLTLARPEIRYDLPAGGRRLTQRAQGYKMTVCGGVPILEDDTLTGAYPGKLIRGPQRAP
jgi:N-acyl-D-aspartate/D-glutamate deacylase